MFYDLSFRVERTSYSDQYLKLLSRQLAPEGSWKTLETARQTSTLPESCLL